MSNKAMSAVLGLTLILGVAGAAAQSCGGDSKGGTPTGTTGGTGSTGTGGDTSCDTCAKLDACCMASGDGGSCGSVAATCTAVMGSQRDTVIALCKAGLSALAMVPSAPAVCK